MINVMMMRVHVRRESVRGDVSPDRFTHDDGDVTAMAAAVAYGPSRRVRYYIRHGCRFRRREKTMSDVSRQVLSRWSAEPLYKYFRPEVAPVLRHSRRTCRPSSTPARPQHSPRYRPRTGNVSVGDLQWLCLDLYIIILFLHRKCHRVPHSSCVFVQCFRPFLI